MYGHSLYCPGKVLVGEGETETWACAGVKLVACGVAMMDFRFRMQSSHFVMVV